MINLKFSISLSSDAKTFTFQDRTGFYSATNQGGWGSPNQLVGTALTATISFAKRNTDGSYGAETTVNSFPTLPSDAGKKVDISSLTALGVESTADGIYKIIYDVTGVSVSVPYHFSSTQYHAFTPNIDGCWQKKAVKVSSCECNCQSIDDDFKCITIFKRLLCAAEDCGDLNSIQKYIDKLTKMCGSDCGCGC